jgi:hypothetical protein
LTSVFRNEDSIPKGYTNRQYSWRDWAKSAVEISKKVLSLRFLAVTPKKFSMGRKIPKWDSWPENPGNFFSVGLPGVTFPMGLLAGMPWLLIPVQ